MAIRSDTFDGTGSLSGNWAIAYGDPERVGGIVRNNGPVGNFGAAYWDADTFGADQWSEVVLGSAVTRWSIGVRQSGTGFNTSQEYSLSAASSTSLEIYRFTSGATFVLLGTAIPLGSALQPGDRVALSIAGNTLTVWVNRTSVATRSDSVIGSGRPGFTVPDDGDVTAWEGGDGDPSQTNQPPATPTVSAAPQGNGSVNLTGSAYSDPEGDAHDSSRWRARAAESTPTASDTFDGSGALSSNWTVIAGNPVRSSGRYAVGSGSEGVALWTADDLGDDVYSEFVVASNDTVGTRLRFTGNAATGNGYLVFRNGANGPVEVYHIQGGAWNNPIASFAGGSSIGPGDVVRVEAPDDSPVLRILINDVLLGQVDITGGILSGGSIGLHVEAGGLVDSWEAGGLGTTAGPVVYDSGWTTTDKVAHTIPAGTLAAGPYFATVQYRDTNLNASSESVPVEFTATGGGAGGFPAVTSTNDSQVTSDSVNHTVTLPGTIAAGNLLIVLFAVDGNPSSVGWPAGWTSFLAGSQGAVSLHGGYRVASGSEGSTISVSTNEAQQSAHQSFAISGAHPTTPPASATATSFNNVNPNPPVLNPSGWAVEDTLWIATFAADGPQQTVSAYPASYANGSSQDTAGGGSVLIASARRERAAASEDPGTFTQSVAEQWVAATIAVRPAP